MRKFATYLPDEAATHALGAALAHALAPGMTLYLHGELGAGKTTLTRALLHAAGHTGRVKSPTYTLAEPYAVTLQGHPAELMHFDLYRLASPDEFLDAGFRDHFGGATTCIVEWPEKAGEALPAPDMHIFLSLKGHGRDVELLGLSDQGVQCIERLHFAPDR